MKKCLKFHAVTDLEKAQEWYENREDKLKSKTHDHDRVVEDFVEGRPRSLKQHIYKASSPGIETDRTMSFYDAAR